MPRPAPLRRFHKDMATSDMVRWLKSHPEDFWARRVYARRLRHEGNAALAAIQEALAEFHESIMRDSGAPAAAGPGGAVLPLSPKAKNPADEPNREG